ncbi:hypothetical protein GGR54DRAFT_615132 [Hypoxylon sp. NC1633]|nr:hypothetical protein GGR54DRAFT_615132 [Hypoxylon sp. NC1633]
MLRRPPTTLTLTAEDIAAYEDRRFASRSQSLAQAQLDSRAPSHPSMPHAHQTAMDTSSSSLTPSPPPAEDDEDMQDADVEAEAEEALNNNPFITEPRRAAREQQQGRSQSPGQARAAYLQQLRARSQQAANATMTAPNMAAPQARMQQRTIATQQQLGGNATARAAGVAAGTTTRGGASRQGSTEPAPGRMMTRSRDERIGLTAPTGGAGAGLGSRRR